MYLYVRILRTLSPHTRISRTLSPYVRIPRPVHCPPQIEHVVRGIPHQRREFVNGEWTSQGDINGDPGHPSSVQEARGRTSQGNINGGPGRPSSARGVRGRTSRGDLKGGPGHPSSEQGTRGRTSQGDINGGTGHRSSAHGVRGRTSQGDINGDPGHRSSAQGARGRAVCEGSGHRGTACEAHGPWDTSSAVFVIVMYNERSLPSRSTAFVVINSIRYRQVQQPSLSLYSSSTLHWVGVG